MTEIQISIPSYRTLFKFKVYGSQKKLLKDNNKIMKCVNGKLDDSITFQGRAYGIHLDKQGFRTALVMVRKECLTHGLIAHEALHAVSYILNFCGIYFDEETEECFTHLLDFIIDSLYIELDLKKIEVKLANI
jgi:hypothetical protein